MKTNNIKKCLYTVVLGVSIVSISALVNAAGTFTTYRANVPVFSNYEIANRTKASSDAYGWVSANTVGGSLVTRIENSGGINITNKISYSTPYAFELKYTDPSYYKGKSVQLNFSNGTNQYSSVSTSGKWSPDQAN